MYMRKKNAFGLYVNLRQCLYRITKCQTSLNSKLLTVHECQQYCLLLTTQCILGLVVGVDQSVHVTAEDKHSGSHAPPEQSLIYLYGRVLPGPLIC